ncbi:MAG: hypothetical protein L7S53_03360, partial [Luminiphilus sp.]|nr:hypothetical protein [Luminiphilus sp.]
LFICVGTPPASDGGADLQYVMLAAETIGTHMDSRKVIITKSTVPVGTADQISARITEILAGRNVDCLVICTEWKVFWSPDFEGIKRRLSAPIIIDGRNLFDPAYMEELGIEYYGIGRGKNLAVGG